MAVADRYTGANVVIEFLPEGGVEAQDVEVLTADFTSFSYDQSTDTVDITASSEDERAFLPTITSLDWTVSAFDTQVGIDKSVMYAGAKGLLRVYPKGITDGEEMFSFNTVINGLNVESPFDGAVEIEITGQRTGAMVVDFGSTVTVLSAPTLTSPADAATETTDTPTFDFGDVGSASFYAIQIASDSAFETIVQEDKNLATSTYTATSLADGTYYWRARAYDANGTPGAWSSTRSVVIDVP